MSLPIVVLQADPLVTERRWADSSLIVVSRHARANHLLVVAAAHLHQNCRGLEHVIGDFLGTRVLAVQ